MGAREGTRAGGVLGTGATTDQFDITATAGLSCQTVAIAVSFAVRATHWGPQQDTAGDTRSGVVLSVGGRVTWGEDTGGVDCGRGILSMRIPPSYERRPYVPKRSNTSCFYSFVYRFFCLSIFSI